MTGLALRLVVAAASLALVTASGHALASLAGTSRRFGPLERVGLGYLAGSAWAGVTAFVVSLVTGAPLVRSLFLPILVLPLAGLVLDRALGRRAGGRPVGPARGLVPRLLRGLAILVGTVVSTVVLLQALTCVATDFDGRMTWLPLARYMRQERTVLPTALTDLTWDVSHPRYPPLVPLLQVSAQEVFDVDPLDERFPRTVYAAFLPAFLLVLSGLARRVAGVRASAAAVVLAATTFALTFESHGGPIGAYSDFPLAAFAGAGGALLVLSRGRDAAIGGLLLAAAALTKNEGALLAAGTVAVAALHGLRRKHAPVFQRLRPALVAGALLVPALAALLAWKSQIPNRADEAYLSFTRPLPGPAELVTAAKRLAPVLFTETFSPRHWGLGTLLLLALLLLAPLGRRRPHLGLVLALTSLPPAIALAAYAVHFDPPLIAGATWTRFLTQASFPALLALALLAREGLVPARRSDSEHDERDRRILDRNADALNREMRDVLEYQGHR